MDTTLLFEALHSWSGFLKDEKVTDHELILCSDVTLDTEEFRAQVSPYSTFPRM